MKLDNVIYSIKFTDDSEFIINEVFSIYESNVLCLLGNNCTDGWNETFFLNVDTGMIDGSYPINTNNPTFAECIQSIKIGNSVYNTTLPFIKFEDGLYHYEQQEKDKPNIGIKFRFCIKDFIKNLSVGTTNGNG